MKKVLISLGVPLCAALLAILAIWLWMQRVRNLEAENFRVPLQQQPVLVKHPQPAPPAPVREPVRPPKSTDIPRPVPEKLPPIATTTPEPAPFSDAPTGPVTAGWPNFRGPERDNISREPVRLNRDWEKNPPPLLWEINDLGEGYAAPVVQNNRVFLLDYDQEKKADNLRCFNFDNGKQLWNYSYPAELKRNHGMSRTVPAVRGNRVVTIGPLGQVHALDPATGSLCWSLDLVKDWGAAIPEWYCGQCPLLDGEQVILAPAGSGALLLAVRLADGKLQWKTANPDPENWKMSHATVIAWTCAGRRTYVYVSRAGVAGVDAATGALLWTYTDWPTIMADVPSPLPLDDQRLFVSRGYEQGALILQVKEANGTFTAEKVKKLSRKVFGSDQQTPILYNGYIYGVRPPRGELVCLDLEGTPKWNSGAGTSFGLGPYLIADGMLLVMDNTGTLTLAEAKPDGYREICKRKLMNGHETWGPLALVGGRLLVRDMQTEKANSCRLACYDLRAPP